VQIYFSGIMKLAAQRYAIRAAMPEGSEEKIQEYMRRLGVQCDFFPGHMDFSPVRSVWHKVRRRLRDARTAIIIARHVKRYDLRNTILHVDLGPWWWSLLLCYLSLRANVFLTLHIALPKQPILRRIRLQTIFSVLCRMPRFHLLVSNREMLESITPYLPASFVPTVRLAYTGIDRAEISAVLERSLDPERIRDRYGLPPATTFAFSLGRLTARKGCLVLLEAVRRVREEAPSLCFVWIGDGDQRAEVEAYLERHVLGDAFRVIPPSRIGPDRLDLLELLRLADFFIHPSFMEGLPGAVLEAMALGKACVASRVNAIPEAITDGENGILVPAGDAEALAGAILRLFNDPELRERLGAAARARVLETFDEAFAAKTTVDYYDRCWESGVPG
jgi:glycosyltransferase involved in cell wall biosynthesis